MPTLSRLPNWESRLQTFFSENQNRKFSYGSWDCALFVSGAVLTMTGTDLASGLRGKYSNRQQARQLVRFRSGMASFKTFFRWMAAEFEIAEIAPKFARRGDVVLVESKGRCSLGIVALDGRRVVLAGETVQGAEGLGFIPLASAVTAWRL